MVSDLSGINLMPGSSYIHYQYILLAIHSIYEVFHTYHRTLWPTQDFKIPINVSGLYTNTTLSVKPCLITLLKIVNLTETHFPSPHSFFSVALNMLRVLHIFPLMFCVPLLEYTLHRWKDFNVVLFLTVSPLPRTVPSTM